MNRPPGGVEGGLYREINRTKAAPQGMCVMNSDGKVLDWVLSFDNEEQTVAFFEYAIDRYQEFPDSKHQFATKRYRRFPSRQMSEVADSGKPIEFPTRHESDYCPGTRKLPDGMLTGKVVGRPVDGNGVPIAKTHHQEDYMEATFDVSASAQRELIAAMTKANGNRFVIPDSFVKAVVGPAYLGQLDVSPLLKVPTGENKVRWWKFFGEYVDNLAEDETATRLRIVGRSHIDGDGNQWNHQVSLDWQGYLQFENGLVSKLDLIARGHEHLDWHIHNSSLILQPACATLMGGHPIDLDSPVVYGMHAAGQSK